MAYIDPEGMFGGDRMALLSDSARFAWPWFWCAGNTVGRLELNYRSFSDTVFRQFKKKPTEQQFWDWVSEFHECHLLFAYEVAGKAWGQWDVSERYLPDYKTKADRLTPAPNVEAFASWKELYAETRRKGALTKCRVFNVSGNLGKILKDFDSSLWRGEERRGEDENLLSAKADESDPEEPIIEPAKPVSYNATWFDEQHEIWLSNYWNRENKKTSRRAFEKVVRFLVATKKQPSMEAAVEFLVWETRRYRERFMNTESWSWRNNMHPATWLNSGRWEDEAGASAPSASSVPMRLL